MELHSIAEIRIHPAIGIARLGNSNKYFLGPEEPGEVPPPFGGYKDLAGRVKKQAARFRLFAFDALGRLLDEITAEDAEITWTVTLANTKAASEKFSGAGNRNADVTDRELLKIRPRPQSLTGPGQSASFDDGCIQFPEKPPVTIPLGQVRTDDAGRLLVLGGDGRAASPTGAEIKNYADNDRWFDDCSDGPVEATVRLRGTDVELSAVPAWVVVGPPKFAPAIDHAITLWDRLFELAVEQRWDWAQIPATPSLRDDVYPILRRAGRMKWVDQEAFTRHAWADMYPIADDLRKKIFGKLRNPNPQGEGGNMPKLYAESAAESLTQSLTRAQYTMMSAWKEGSFQDDLFLPRPAPTPLALDRAVLDACVGAALWPGIEVGLFLVKNPDKYLHGHGPGFRLDLKKVEAGDVSARMAVPWQADFHACDDNWWPAHRPNQVIPSGHTKHLEWARDINNYEGMVKLWATRGFVVREGNGYYEQGGPPVSAEDPVSAAGLVSTADPGAAAEIFQ